MSRSFPSLESSTVCLWISNSAHTSEVCAAPGGVSVACLFRTSDCKQFDDSRCVGRLCSMFHVVSRVVVLCLAEWTEIEETLCRVLSWPLWCYYLPGRMTRAPATEVIYRVFGSTRQKDPSFVSFCVSGCSDYGYKCLLQRSVSIISPPIWEESTRLKITPKISTTPKKKQFSLWYVRPLILSACKTKLKTKKLQRINA